jgi:hypothetical protein
MPIRHPRSHLQGSLPGRTALDPGRRSNRAPAQQDDFYRNSSGCSKRNRLSCRVRSEEMTHPQLTPTIKSFLLLSRRIATLADSPAKGKCEHLTAIGGCAKRTANHEYWRQVVANCFGAQRTTVLPPRVMPVAALSTGVKGSTLVVSLVLGGVSEPSQSSRFPGAEVFGGAGAPLVCVKIAREIVQQPCRPKSCGALEILLITPNSQWP